MPQDRTRATEDRPAAEGTPSREPQQAQQPQSGRQAAQVLGAGLRNAPGRRQYLLGILPSPYLSGMQGYQTLYDNVRRIPDVRIVKEIQPHGQTAPVGLIGPTHTLVLEMSTRDAERVAEAIHLGPALQGALLEEDAFLRLSEQSIATNCRLTLSQISQPLSTMVNIVNQDEHPVSGADVILIGKSGAVQAVTDSSGQARLTLFDEVPSEIESIYVRPARDYWSYWVSQPGLDPDKPTQVRLARLDQVFPRFPDQPLVGWGLKAMRLDALPTEQFHGQGIRIALLDSGCANHHRNLRRVQDGLDMLDKPGNGWMEDEIGHGTHCAGIIAGDGATTGIRGIAPRAELLPIKIPPHGRISDVIDALDQCIQRGVDVVALSYATDERSILLEQKIAEARDLGIACIAPVGDSSGPVRFPARLPTVLAVAAIGWRAAFPSDSHHAQAIPAGGGSQDGYFVAGFSCAGPEVDVCGPGVAVVSAAPPDNYAARDGSAVAAAHVVGLAALVLGHHPDFAAGGVYSQRTAQRVDRLFHILTASARPFRIGDVWHTGSGLPDAVRALNAAADVGSPGQLDEAGAHSVLQSLVDAARLGGSAPSEIQSAQVAATLQRVGLGAGSRDEVQRMMESLERVGLRDGIRAQTTGGAPRSAAPASVGDQLAAALARVGL